ncbi:hypothetical protein ACFL3D_04440 [Candidatus Omnitrophota bacterium]
MKKLSALIVVGILVLSPLAFAGKGGEKGASDAALEHASDQAIFNRTADWFATIGKSGEEKEAILAERKATRAEKRLQKEAKKAKKQADKEAKRAEKEAEEAMDEAKGNAEKKGKNAKKDLGKLKEKMKKGKK